MVELNEKQIRILQVAEKLFAEKGFDGTSIRNISKRRKSTSRWCRIISAQKNECSNR
ncbi:TetR/AcrR family transcriptional regulator [Flavobacterium sp. 3HN19-14]|uniref:TetR/AcrR family transcriptional regulator n=1 Tax=Flavobacterium sp. 3HN19-14 TaxID=3448133 RepID=UPI003EE122F2